MNGSEELKDPKKVITIDFLKEKGYNRAKWWSNFMNTQLQLEDGEEEIPIDDIEKICDAEENSDDDSSSNNMAEEIDRLDDDHGLYNTSLHGTIIPQNLSASNAKGILAQIDQNAHVTGIMDEEIRDVLEQTLPVLEEYRREWRENGFERILNTFDLNKIEAKVGDWIRHNSTLMPIRNSGHCTKQKLYERQTAKGIDDADTDSDSLHSIDTARYIRSCKKYSAMKKSCSTKMTIKSYRLVESKRDEIHRKYAYLVPDETMQLLKNGRLRGGNLPYCALTDSKPKRHVISSNIRSSRDTNRISKRHCRGRHDNSFSSCSTSDEDEMIRRHFSAKTFTSTCHREKHFHCNGHRVLSQTMCCLQNQHPHCKCLKGNTPYSYNIAHSRYNDFAPFRYETDCACYEAEKLCSNVIHLANSSTEEWLVENCESPKISGQKPKQKDSLNRKGKRGSGTEHIYGMDKSKSKELEYGTVENKKAKLTKSAMSSKSKTKNVSITVNRSEDVNIKEEKNDFNYTKESLKAESIEIQSQACIGDMKTGNLRKSKTNNPNSKSVNDKKDLQPEEVDFRKNKVIKKSKKSADEFEKHSVDGVSKKSKSTKQESLSNGTDSLIRDEKPSRVNGHSKKELLKIITEATNNASESEIDEDEKECSVESESFNAQIEEAIRLSKMLFKKENEKKDLSSKEMNKKSKETNISMDMNELTLKTHSKSAQKSKNSIEPKKSMPYSDLNIAEKTNNNHVSSLSNVVIISDDSNGSEVTSLGLCKNEEIQNTHTTLTTSSLSSENTTFFSNIGKVCNSTALGSNTNAKTVHIRQSEKKTKTITSSKKTAPKKKLKTSSAVVSTTNDCGEGVKQKQKQLPTIMEHDHQTIACTIVSSTTDVDITHHAMGTSSNYIPKNKRQTHDAKEIILYAPHKEASVPSHSILNGQFHITEDYLSSIIGHEKAAKFLRYYVGPRSFNLSSTVFYRPPKPSADTNISSDSDDDILDLCSRYGELYETKNGSKKTCRK